MLCIILFSGEVILEYYLRRYDFCTFLLHTPVAVWPAERNVWIHELKVLDMNLQSSCFMAFHTVLWYHARSTGLWNFVNLVMFIWDLFWNRMYSLPVAYPSIFCCVTKTINSNFFIYLFTSDSGRVFQTVSLSLSQVCVLIVRCIFLTFTLYQ